MPPTAEGGNFHLNVVDVLFVQKNLTVMRNELFDRMTFITRSMIMFTPLQFVRHLLFLSLLPVLQFF